MGVGREKKGMLVYGYDGRLRRFSVDWLCMGGIEVVGLVFCIALL